MLQQKFLVLRNENLKDSRLLQLVTTLKILNILIIGCLKSISLFT